MRGRRPAVCVVIPTFDRIEFLKPCLESVYAQTFRGFEIVVVDDGSTDGTARWLASRRLPRLTLLRNARNRGPARARNRALAAASAQLLAFLDSDDLWRPGYLDAMTRAFRDPGIVAAFSGYDRIDERGRLRRGAGRPRRNLALEAVAGLETPPPPSTMVIRRQACRELGGFDERFGRVNEDIDFLLRAGLRYGPASFRLQPRKLVLRRRHGGQISRRLQIEPLDTAWLNLKHRWWLELLAEGAGPGPSALRP